MVVIDEEPLTVEEAFLADKVTYVRHDTSNQWHELFLPFSVAVSDNVKVVRMAKKANNTLYCRMASGSQANTPALMMFTDPALTLHDVAVVPTEEYENPEWGINGTYRAGGDVTPLRWKMDGVTSLDDMDIIILGDVNRDGFITVSDITALVDIILGMDSTKPYRYDHEAGDMNTDGVLSVSDVTMIVNAILSNNIEEDY
jgi:hypothetical protein